MSSITLPHLLACADDGRPIALREFRDVVSDGRHTCTETDDRAKRTCICSRSLSMGVSREPEQVITIAPEARYPDAQTAERFEAAHKSAAYWNGLLMWAREERGPQWDSSTAVYMCDKNSHEATAYVEQAPPTAEELAAEAAQANAYAHPERTTRSRRAEGPNQDGLLTGDAYARAFSDGSEDDGETTSYQPRPSRSRAR